VLIPELKTLIPRLDPGSFTSFVEGLLLAERARLGLPFNALVLSDAITEADEGLDARLEGVPEEAPDGTPAQLPAGNLGLQLKTVGRKQPSALALDTELARPGPRRTLESGGTYIVVWSQDLNDAQRRAVEGGLRGKAAAIVEGAQTQVWDATALAALSQVHPGVVAEAGLVDFGSALSLGELMAFSLRADERPFISDEQRESLIARVHERAARSDPLLLTVLGDPGAGKTRAVAEALDHPDLRESVLYVNGAEDLVPLLHRLVRNASSRGILFLEEVDNHEINTAMSRIAGLNGRWRIVAVTSRRVRRWQPAGPRDVILEPLSGEATERLVREHSGLGEHQARLVAEVASGFPELAFRLAEELRDQPNLDLVSLARLHRPIEVLDRALADAQTRQHLAPLALFKAVGFEEDLRYQVEAVAAAFGLEPDALKHYADAELGRFVSRAGRYRLVTPRLVAVWLAVDLIERTPAIDVLIEGLPGPLQDAFVGQLELFGPDVPHLPDALARVLGDARFRSPTRFNDAAGRLLRASAAIVPAQVVGAINELLRACTSEELQTLPRRELVWSLEVLLWWPSTWESALELMYLLARHETETWANNATGQFSQFFAIYLAGTTVPYPERIGWLRRQISAADEENLDLLSLAAAAGLKQHHSRSVTGFPAGGEPADWQPALLQDYFDARRLAIEGLLECRDLAIDEDRRLSITERFARALPTLYPAQAEYVDEQIRAREWTSSERAELMAGLSRLVKYESQEMPEEVSRSIESLIRWVEGEDFVTRAEVLLSTAMWDLHQDRDDFDDPPLPLRRLAEELVSHPDSISLALLAGRSLNDQHTRYQWLKLVAERLGPKAVGEAALEDLPKDWAMVAAAFGVADALGESTWTSKAFAKVAREDPEKVIDLLAAGDLKPERVELALSAVEEGRAPAGRLADLLYGARINEVTEARAIRLVEVVSTVNPESALGMLHQRVEQAGQLSDELVALATSLALDAAKREGTSMGDHYLERLVQRGMFSSEALLDLWEQRLFHRSDLPSALDKDLTDSALAADPQEAMARMLTFLREQASGRGGFGLFASGGLALLSRAAKVISPEVVWEQLRGLTELDLRWALHHMDWAGNNPDPLVRVFLLSDRLADVENEAVVCFFNTLGVVAGPFHLALERELERAKSWHSDLAGTSAEDWAKRLVARYERDVEETRRREAEEDLYLG
jgi:hypothetical protein